jgi:rRNA-processing protein FCF1
MASDRLWGNPDKKVILDSNAILMLFEFSIDLRSELTRLLGKYEVIIPEPIIDELTFLSENGKGKQKMLSKASLKLIKEYKIVKIEAKNPDESVYLLAKKTNGVVVTNDVDLRKKLKKEKIPVIFLRAKKRLELN